MLSQYPVRMPFILIDCVCVWGNTHKSWFLESPFMMDDVSECLYALICQENLEPATCKDLINFSSPVQMCMQKGFDKIPLDDCTSNEGNLCWSNWSLLCDKIRICVNGCTNQVSSSNREGNPSSLVAHQTTEKGIQESQGAGFEKIPEIFFCFVLSFMVVKCRSARIKGTSLKVVMEGIRNNSQFRSEKYFTLH